MAGRLVEGGTGRTEESELITRRGFGFYGRSNCAKINTRESGLSVRGDVPEKSTGTEVTIVMPIRKGKRRNECHGIGALSAD